MTQTNTPETPFQRYRARRFDRNTNWDVTEGDNGTRHGNVQCKWCDWSTRWTDYIYNAVDEWERHPCPKPWRVTLTVDAPDGDRADVDIRWVATADDGFDLADAWLTEVPQWCAPTVTMRHYLTRDEPGRLESVEDVRWWRAYFDDPDNPDLLPFPS